MSRSMGRSGLRPVPVGAPSSSSLLRNLVREVRRSRLGIFSVAVLLGLTLLAAVAPWIAPYDPLVQSLPEQFMAPSLRHPFGTDEFGRDLLSRVIYGGRISLSTAVVAVSLAVAGGVPLGLVAGYFGRLTDSIIVRFLDFLLSIPAILLAMAIVAVLGASSVNAMFAVAVVAVPAFARLARASTLMQKNKEYVEAARCIGCTDFYILRSTILPNAWGPLIVQMTVAAAMAVLLEAALSFLGLGTRPPDPSWGQMLSSGRSHLARAWWYGLFPGIALTLLVISLNFLADSLQAAIDPRFRGHKNAEGGG